MKQCSYGYVYVVNCVTRLQLAIQLLLHYTNYVYVHSYVASQLHTYLAMYEKHYLNIQLIIETRLGPYVHYKIIILAIMDHIYPAQKIFKHPGRVQIIFTLFSYRGKDVPAIYITNQHKNEYNLLIVLIGVQT